jgi:hypothetical protein
MMPLRLADAPAGGVVEGGTPPGVSTGRDWVVPADAGVVETGTAGRDIVDDADDAAAEAAAARIPVVEAGDETVPTPVRIPVEPSEAGEIGFAAEVVEDALGGTGVGAAGGAAGAAAVPAPAAGSVVPQCTQNFAPG